MTDPQHPERAHIAYNGIVLAIITLLGPGSPGKGFGLATGSYLAQGGNRYDRTSIQISPWDIEKEIKKIMNP